MHKDYKAVYTDGKLEEIKDTDATTKLSLFSEIAVFMLFFNI